MARPLPKDLFTEQIGRGIKGPLERFRDGEMSREEVIADALARVREGVEVAMNTIAASQGADPKAEKLEKKK